MTVFKIRKCDGCGAEKPADEMYSTKQWHSQNHNGHDFCTFECLDEWLKRNGGPND